MSRKTAYIGQDSGVDGSCALFQSVQLAWQPRYGLYGASPLGHSTAYVRIKT